MKLQQTKIVHTMLAILCFFAITAHIGYAQNIPSNQLPSDVKQSIESIAVESGFTIRNVNRGTQNSKVYYMASARKENHPNLTIIVSEDGKLIDQYKSGQFRIHNNRLYRERSPYHIRTILTPNAGDPDQAPGALISAISRISKVGGNTLVMDVHGFNDDGTKLDERSLDHINNTLSRLNYSGIRLAIRVTGQATPKDVGSIERLVGKEGKGKGLLIRKRRV